MIGYFQNIFQRFCSVAQDMTLMQWNVAVAAVLVIGFFCLRSSNDRI